MGLAQSLGFGVGRLAFMDPGKQLYLDSEQKLRAPLLTLNIPTILRYAHYAT